ncbi:hypothetical protein ACQ4PT_029642 [Festuca glaucescens]
MAAPTASFPDWAELPYDALLAVLHRLDDVDVLAGAGQVCRLWRQAARDEPELWRRVELRPSRNVDVTSRAVLCGLARAAVRRAAGRCEAFCANLLRLWQPSLKSLRIISGGWIVDARLKLTVAKFGLLEELELSLCVDIYTETCEAAGAACPLLKRFRLSRERFFRWNNTKKADLEAMAIATMRGLRELQLFASLLTAHGLTAILDGCTRLESLDVRHCFDVAMGGDAIRARCPGIQTLRLPADTMADYDLDFSTPTFMTPWEDTQDKYYCDWHELVYLSSW